MKRYRVALRVHDLLVTETVGTDEEDAKRRALLALAMYCADDEESTVEVVTVAELIET